MPSRFAAGSQHRLHRYPSQHETLTPKVGSMLFQRLRRWPNIDPTLGVNISCFLGGERWPYQIRLSSQQVVHEIPVTTGQINEYTGTGKGFTVICWSFLQTGLTFLAAYRLILHYIKHVVETISIATHNMTTAAEMITVMCK